MVVSVLSFLQGLVEKNSTVQKKDKYLAGLHQRANAPRPCPASQLRLKAIKERR
jgi:hypothetical protein